MNNNWVAVTGPDGKTDFVPRNRFPGDQDLLRPMPPEHRNFIHVDFVAMPYIAMEPGGEIELTPGQWQQIETLARRSERPEVGAQVGESMPGPDCTSGSEGVVPADGSFRLRWID